MHQVGHLGRTPHRCAVFQRVVIRHHTTAFHGVGAAAVLPDMFVEHMGGVGESGIDIAVILQNLSQHVAVHVGAVAGRTGLHRRLAVADRG